MVGAAVVVVVAGAEYVVVYCSFLSKKDCYSGVVQANKLIMELF